MAKFQKYRYPKVLLISFGDYRRSEYDEALGLGYLAAYLRKNGFVCDILDANLPRLKRLSNVEIAGFIKKRRYDLVGITVFTNFFNSTMALARDIKDIFPQADIVLGGHHVTFTHKDVLLEYPFINYIVRGEGEYTLLELARRIREGKGLDAVDGLTFRSKGQIVVNLPRALIKDIDTFPFPVRDKLKYKFQPKNWCVASVITSRGCPCQCSFCSISAFYKSQPGPFYRLRSPANIIEEIESLVKSFGIRRIFFKDDNMFTNAQRLIYITDKLSSKGIVLKYNLIARADDVVRNERYLPILKKRGLVYVEVGIESGSKDMLKRFSKQASVETNRRAIEILTKNKIDILLDYIMFEPYMSLKDFRENIDFIKALGIAPFKNRDFVSENLLQRLDVHPGTAYYRRMAEEKTIKGSIFVPEWDFKDRDMRKLYRFLCEYTNILTKKISHIRRRIAARLIEVNMAKDKSDIIENRLKKGVLKYMDYELDRIFLYLFESAVTMGSRYNFSKKGFLKTGSKIEKRLAAIKERIIA